MFTKDTAFTVVTASFRSAIFLNPLTLLHARGTFPFQLPLAATFPRAHIQQTKAGSPSVLFTWDPQPASIALCFYPFS